jgi:hypothetical protein
METMKRHAVRAIAVCAILAPLAAQERPAADINAQIRAAEAAHSQIMRTLHAPR